MAKFYMVYLAKDDSIVAVGSAKECTKQMGLKSESAFRDLVSKASLGKIKKYEVIISDSDTIGDDE